MSPDAGASWSEQDTTPGAIEVALRGLLREQFARDHAYVPARVLNLVVIADREWRGEVLNRLDRVGRYHASRTIVCAVEPGRTSIDAMVAITADGAAHKAELALTRERVVLDLGEEHLEKLHTIVDPLVVTDLATVVWSPHGHPEAVDALLDLAQVVLVDSVNEPDPVLAVTRARELAERAYVVDLAWLRSTPWRERVAATFDPARWRCELANIDLVRVRHEPDSALAGVLFCGWLASRLGWEPGRLDGGGDGTRTGHARSGAGREVALELVGDAELKVPGLAGVEIGTSSGMCMSLDRGVGGLTARRVDGHGGEWCWTVLGASRGESGILGEGIRQALLRDPAYRQALERAEVMLR